MRIEFTNGTAIWILRNRYFELVLDGKINRVEEAINLYPGDTVIHGNKPKVIKYVTSNNIFHAMGGIWESFINDITSHPREDRFYKSVPKTIADKIIHDANRTASYLDI